MTGDFVKAIDLWRGDHVLGPTGEVSIVAQVMVLDEADVPGDPAPMQITWLAGPETVCLESDLFQVSRRGPHPRRSLPVES